MNSVRAPPSSSFRPHAREKRVEIRDRALILALPVRCVWFEVGLQGGSNYPKGNPYPLDRISVVERLHEEWGMCLGGPTARDTSLPPQCFLLLVRGSAHDIPSASASPATGSTHRHPLLTKYLTANMGLPHLNASSLVLHGALSSQKAQALDLGMSGEHKPCSEARRSPSFLPTFLLLLFFQCNPSSHPSPTSLHLFLPLQTPGSSTRSCRKRTLGTGTAPAP